MVDPMKPLSGHPLDSFLLILKPDPPNFPKEKPLFPPCPPDYTASLAVFFTKSLERLDFSLYYIPFRYTVLSLTPGPQKHGHF